MFHTYEIEVAASTAETSPTITKVQLSHGVITRVSFRPRPGHAALCHCRVFYHDTQIAPADRDQDLHGDTFPIEWDDFIEIFARPYELRIVAWNEDDTYSHTFDISFALLSKWEVLPYAISRALSSIVGLISPRRVRGGG